MCQQGPVRQLQIIIKNSSLIRSILMQHLFNIIKGPCVGCLKIKRTCIHVVRRVSVGVRFAAVMRRDEIGLSANVGNQQQTKLHIDVVIACALFSVHLPPAACHQHVTYDHRPIGNSRIAQFTSPPPPHQPPSSPPPPQVPQCSSPRWQSAGAGLTVVDFKKNRIPVIKDSFSRYPPTLGLLHTVHCPCALIHHTHADVSLHRSWQVHILHPLATELSAHTAAMTAMRSA